MTVRWSYRDGSVLVVTVLLASWLPAVVSTAPELPAWTTLVPGVALTGLLAVGLAVYHTQVSDLDRYATTRARALLYAVFAFYVTATVTFTLVGWRLGIEQTRALPVVAWTVVSSVVVAVVVRGRIRDAGSESTDQ